MGGADIAQDPIAGVSACAGTKQITPGGPQASLTELWTSGSSRATQDPRVSNDTGSQAPPTALPGIWQTQKRLKLRLPMGQSQARGQCLPSVQPAAPSLGFPIKNIPSAQESHYQTGSHNSCCSLPQKKGYKESTGDNAEDQGSRMARLCPAVGIQVPRSPRSTVSSFHGAGSTRASCVDPAARPAAHGFLPGCHGPEEQTQQALGRGQLIYFKYSLQLESNHVWVSGLEHELIALSSAPSPALPA